MPASPLTVDELRPALPAALSVTRWVDDVLAGAPYGSVDLLVAAALEAASPLTDEEVDEAIAHHPRIGERPEGEDQEAQFSLTEQASFDADDADLAAQIADGNREYEEKFGRVFIIRAAGRSRAEILIELRRRLQLDDATDRATTAEQLRQIMELRLRSLFDASAGAGTASGRTPITTHVLDTAIGRPAARIPVTLEVQVDGEWSVIGDAITDEDGRVAQLGPESINAGRYRITFDTGAYFAAQDLISFFPEASVVFDVWSTDEHFHIPLLLSPFAFSTYRGT